MISRILAGLFIAVLGATVSVIESAEIRGVITDDQGKPLVGATVVVLPCRAQEVQTEEDGSFVLPNLPGGRYTVIMIGPALVGTAYAPRVKHDLSLAPSETASLRVQLEVEERRLLVYYDLPTEQDQAAYEQILTQFEEPGMCSPEISVEAKESYRFLWLRSFNNPVLIRLVLDKTGSASLRYKELTREGPNIGELTENRSVDVRKLRRQELGDAELAESVLDHFRRRAEESFWSLSYKVDDGTVGVDGATWVIEGTKDGRCHLVSRWSPEETDGFRRLAEEMISFSGKRFYYDEVY